MTAVQAFTTTGLIGIEVELSIPEYDLQEYLGVDNVGYNHEVYDRFVIKHDGSCGSEIVTPPIPAAYKGPEYDTLAGMLRLVNERGRSTNDNCSVHVHVGVEVNKPDNVEAQLFRLWRLYDYYRRDAVNDWCGPKRDPERSDHAQRYCGRFLASHGRKYGQINATQLWRHLDPYAGDGMSTVEFRQMHASTDIDRIWQWATFCYLLVNASRRPSIMRDLAPFAATDEMRSLMLPRRPRPKQKAATPNALVTGVRVGAAASGAAEAEPVTASRGYGDVRYSDIVEWLSGIDWTSTDPADLTNLTTVTTWIRNRYDWSTAAARPYARRFIADIAAIQNVRAESPDPSDPGPWIGVGAGATSYYQIDRWLTDHWIPATSPLDLAYEFGLNHNDATNALTYWLQEQDTLSEGEEHVDEVVAALAAELSGYRPDRGEHRTNAVTHLCDTRGISVPEATALVEAWAETYGGVTDPTAPPDSDRLSDTTVERLMRRLNLNRTTPTSHVVDAIRRRWPTNTDSQIIDYADRWYTRLPWSEARDQLYAARAETWGRAVTRRYLVALYPNLPAHVYDAFADEWLRTNLPPEQPREIEDIVNDADLNYYSDTDDVIETVQYARGGTEEHAADLVQMWADRMDPGRAYEYLDDHPAPPALSSHTNDRIAHYHGTLRDAYPSMSGTRCDFLARRYEEAINGPIPEPPADPGPSVNTPYRLLNDGTVTISPIGSDGRPNPSYARYVGFATGANSLHTSFTNTSFTLADAQAAVDNLRHAFVDDPLIYTEDEDVDW